MKEALKELVKTVEDIKFVIEKKKQTTKPQEDLSDCLKGGRQIEQLEECLYSL